MAILRPASYIGLSCCPNISWQVQGNLRAAVGVRDRQHWGHGRQDGGEGGGGGDSDRRGHRGQVGGGRGGELLID